MPRSTSVPRPRGPTDRRRLRPRQRYGVADTLSAEATDFNLPPQKTGLDLTRRKRSEKTLSKMNTKDCENEPVRHVRQAASPARSCPVFRFPCTFMVHGSPAPGAGRKKFFPAGSPEDGTADGREHSARTADYGTTRLPFPNGSGSMTGSFRNPLYPAAKQVVYFLIRQGG